MIDKELLEFLKVIFLELSKILGYGLICSASILMLLCGLVIIVVTSKNLLNKNINVKLPKKITTFISKMSKKIEASIRILSLYICYWVCCVCNLGYG